MNSNHITSSSTSARYATHNNAMKDRHVQQNLTTATRLADRSKIPSDSFTASLTYLRQLALSSSNSRINDDERDKAIANEGMASLMMARDSIAVRRSYGDGIRDLSSVAVQAANTAGMSGAEAGAIGLQVSSILTSISQTTSGLGIDVMNGVTAELVVGVDEATGDDITQTVSLSDLARVIVADPAVAQQLVDGAREMAVGAQAQAGLDARSAASDRRVLEEEQINVARAHSQFRDVDYAKESSNLIRSQILNQASAMAAFAEHQSAKNVLTLLL